MGIDHQTFTKTSWYPDHASDKVPGDEETRLQYFCELIILSQVDLNKSDEEGKLLHNLAEQIHIPKDKVDKLRNFLEENKLPKDVSELLNQL